MCQFSVGEVGGMGTAKLGSYLFSICFNLRGFPIPIVWLVIFILCSCSAGWGVTEVPGVGFSEILISLLWVFWVFCFQFFLVLLDFDRSSS